MISGLMALLLLAEFNLSAALAGEEPVFTICPEPRPEICTMDYTPVCARHIDGSFKTYSNGCTACTNPSVEGYVEGACESE
jgi:hypothetical protein